MEKHRLILLNFDNDLKIPPDFSYNKLQQFGLQLSSEGNCLNDDMNLLRALAILNFGEKLRACVFYPVRDGKKRTEMRLLVGYKTQTIKAEIGKNLEDAMKSLSFISWQEPIWVEIQERYGVESERYLLIKRRISTVNDATLMIAIPERDSGVLSNVVEATGDWNCDVEEEGNEQIEVLNPIDGAVTNRKYTDLFSSSSRVTLFLYRVQT